MYFKSKSIALIFFLIFEFNNLKIKQKIQLFPWEIPYASWKICLFVFPLKILDSLDKILYTN